MTTTYPSSIDGYINIRFVRDRIEEVVARDHNDCRSAIIAIEQTLGLMPQGAYGTVVARLDDAYQCLDDHVRGLPPRHNASQIDADLISGYPHYNFTYPDNTVATQLARLLAYTNYPEYSGSGARRFADGYQLPTGTYLESTVSEIAGRLGSKTAPDGADKIGYKGSAPTTFADGYALISSRLGASVTQIVAQLGGVLGDTKIGANTFTTYNGKFPFLAGSVSSQMDRAGNLLDEESLILQQSLGGFIVSGLAVTRLDANTVGISAGMACVKGRMLEYAGDPFVHSGIGAHNIYTFLAASGDLQMADTPSIDVFAGAAGNQPTIMLESFTESGAGWTDSSDLRRYGMFMNNKPYITVGSDGYGADFTSIYNAIAYVETIRNTTSGLNKPRKILITSDIVVPNSEIPIGLPGGIEIDGGGHTLSWDADAALFNNIYGTPTDHITLRNIKTLYTNIGSGATAAFANFIGIGSSDFRVIDCELTRDPAAAANSYFVLFDTTFGIISDVLVSGCSAQVNISGAASTGGLAVYYARIVNNRFYQDAFAPTAGSCISVGPFSIVEGNIIYGGYSKGIEVNNAESTVISGNVINGGTGLVSVPGTPLMIIGIHVETYAANFSLRSIVSNNVIKGTAEYGISCQNGGNSAGSVLISDNIIDNIWDHNDAVSIGIYAEGVDTLVVGNYIMHPGLCGIQDASHIVGNFILGSVTLTTTAGILCSTGINKIVVNNILDTVAGVGIYMNKADFSLAAGNIMVANAVVATVGILEPGHDCLITNNQIAGYGTAAIRLTAALDGQGTSIIGNFLGSKNSTSSALIGIGIDVNSNFNCMIVGNHISSTGSGTGEGIKDAGPGSLISGNMIESPNGDGIVAIGYASIISSNTINEPKSDGYGIKALVADFSVITGNVIGTMGTTLSGIVVGGSIYVTVANNFVFGFDKSIIVGMYSSYTSELCNIVGNTCQRPSHHGIHLDSGSAGANITNNLIDDCTRGITASIGDTNISSNLISRYSVTAIDIAGASRCNVCGNMGRSPSGGGDVDGIDASGVNVSLITGNWMEAQNLGHAFILPGTFSGGDALVVVGNLATGGVVPSDCAGGTWGLNPVCDDDNRKL